MAVQMKSKSGNPKVDALLNDPNVSGIAKFLIDRWRGLITLLHKYELELARAERALAELRSQQLKCAGGVETVEAMIGEFELPVAGQPPQTPPPTPPVSVSVDELKARREAMRASARSSAAMPPPPLAPEDEGSPLSSEGEKKETEE